MSMINTTSKFKNKNNLYFFQHFSFYEQLKFQTQLNMKKVLLPQCLIAADKYQFESGSKLCDTDGISKRLF